MFIINLQEINENCIFLKLYKQHNQLEFIYSQFNSFRNRKCKSSIDHVTKTEILSFTKNINK